MRLLESLMQLVGTWNVRRKINRFIRQVQLEYELVQGLSLAEVELFFIPGVNAPDAPVFVNRGVIFGFFVGAVIVANIILYLIVHLSPPLW